MISPSFWTDEKVGRLPRDARLLFIALHNYADDEGRLVYSPARIKLQVFPYDDDITPDAVAALIAQLAKHNCVVKYDVNGGTYLQITDFRNSQRVDRPTPSKLPPPPNAHSRPQTPLQLLDAIMPGRVSTVDRDWLYDVIDTYGEHAVIGALRECKRLGSEVRSVRRFVEAVAARIKNEGNGNGRHTGSHLSQEELDMLERARRRLKLLKEQGVL